MGSRLPRENTATKAVRGYLIRMEFRQLGSSGLQVPILCFGTVTFGAGNEFFRAWGEIDVQEAARLIEVCLEAGVNFFDTANVYSQGRSEEILGEAIRRPPRETIQSAAALLSSLSDTPPARTREMTVEGAT